MKVWQNEPLEANVAHAYTLDASWYLDPAVFELEVEVILLPHRPTGFPRWTCRLADLHPWTLHL